MPEGQVDLSFLCSIYLMIHVKLPNYALSEHFYETQVLGHQEIVTIQVSNINKLEECCRRH